MCPRFNALRIPFSSGSLFTMSSLIFTLAQMSLLSVGRSGVDRSNLISSLQCWLLLISPCLSISAYPERMFGVSSVFKKDVSNITAMAELKTPTSFLSPLKLMPVLPPTEASTIESSVVGMFMNCIPRLKVDAANPPRSVTIPPPRFISSEWRVAPLSLRAFHTCASDSMFLFSSLGLI